MTNKIRLTAIISGSILIAGGMLGAGVGIGLSISQQNEKNEVYQQKKQMIIEKRSHVNNLTSNYIENYIKSPDFTKYYVWQKEFGDFFRSLYFPPDNNIDINKQWYENYGPLYQSDRFYFNGKWILSQINDTDLTCYYIAGDPEQKDIYTIGLPIGIWEIVDQNADGTWNFKIMCWIVVMLNFNNDF